MSPVRSASAWDGQAAGCQIDQTPGASARPDNQETVSRGSTDEQYAMHALSRDSDKKEGGSPAARRQTSRRAPRAQVAVGCRRAGRGPGRAV